MIIVYNQEMEAYFKIYACVIDPHGKYKNYECTTDIFIKKTITNFDRERQAVIISNAEWQLLKQNLNDWIDYKPDKLITSEQIDTQKDIYNELYETCFNSRLFEKSNQDEKWSYYFLLPNEQRYFEILKAIPLYNIYDKWGELENEDWDDTLEEVKQKAADDIFPTTIIPRSAEECTFEYKLCRWSGEI